MVRPSRLRWLWRTRSALFVGAFVGGVSGCHHRPTPYRSAMLEAESARRAGNFDEERNRFEEATRLAQKSDDADEARYRRAESFAREGQYETAAQELEAFARTFPESGRAARAWLDAGRNWERAKNEDKALLAFTKVVKNYANSGSALTAADRVVALRSSLHGLSPHDEWRRLLDNNQSRELDEGLRYRYAQTLETVSISQALLAYEDVAKNHPLPGGSLADEALLRAAELRLQLKDAKGSLQTLELLLEQGGRAAIVGSYTRTAYIEALLLKGKIQRDNLGEAREALHTFHSLPDKYPNSRLVDDALWEAVRTERILGETGCSSLKSLFRFRPQSRFTRCQDFICGGASTEEANNKECVRFLEGPRGED